MRAIETLARVGKDHTVNIKLKLPNEVAPGDYNVLVVMDKERREIEAAGEKVFECLTWDWDAWPESCSFRREDIYGKEGR